MNNHAPKTYIAQRTPDGNLIIVQPLGAHPYPLPHIIYHSPTGLEWSYAGSGPADLALSILADHFGERPRSLRAIENTRAWKHHQRFKHHFIAPAHFTAFILSSQDIDQWLQTQSLPEPD